MKKKQLKRLLAWLLCMCMVVTLMPSVAFAAEDTYDYVISYADGNYSVASNTGADTAGVVASTGSTLTITAADKTVKLDSSVSNVSDTIEITTAADASIEGSVEKLVTGDVGTVTVTGDVGTLTATAGTVRVNGNVGNYTQESNGSPIVEITGNLGSDQNSAAVSTNNNGANSINVTLKVKGELIGKIDSVGANASDVHMEIGEDAPVKFVVHDAAYGEVAASFTDNTLTFDAGGENGQCVKAEGDGAVTYDVVIERGVFDANDKDVEGNVTFASDKDTNEIRSGNTLDDAGKIKGGIVFAENAKGFVNMRVDNQDRDGNGHTVSIGDGATAKFSFADLSVADKDADNKYVGTIVKELGDNVAIELAGAKPHGVDTALIAKVGSCETGYGNNVTFKLDAGAKIYASKKDGTDYEPADNAAIVTAAGAKVTLAWTAAHTLESAVTVGEEAYLTIQGAGAAQKLTVGGGALTSVMENGTLQLKNVDHTRTGTANRNIVTNSGSKVILDTSDTYTGDPDKAIGSFETGNQDADYGIPTTVNASYDGTDASTGTVTAFAEPVEAEVSATQAIYYTGVKLETTSDDPATSTYTLSLETYPYELENAKPETVTRDEDGNVRYTNESGVEQTVAKPAATYTAVGNAVFTSKGYAIIQVAPGYKVQVSRNNETVDPASLVPQSNLLSLTDVGADATVSRLKTTDKMNLAFLPVDKTTEEPSKVEILDKDLGVVSDAAVDLINGNYSAHFIVNPGDTMTIDLIGKGAQINSASTFDIGYGATLIIKGDGSANQGVNAMLPISKDNVTVELNKVTLTGTGDSRNFEKGSLTVDPAVKNATLKITGDVTIKGVDGARWVSGADGNASNLGHKMSAGIQNLGELTIDVNKNATLKANGGTADQIENNTEAAYSGGAGICNTASGDLTFQGEGVIQLTGGVGGRGYSYKPNDVATTATGAAQGGTGGRGGKGLRNGGKVTVAMTSAQWSQGQLVVIGGQGGDGGKGQKAKQATCTVTPGDAVSGGGRDTVIEATTSGKGGTGGDGGVAVYSVNLNVASGVFLAYSGAAGSGGMAGDTYPSVNNGTTYHVQTSSNPTVVISHPTCSGHSSSGGNGDNGQDKYGAIGAVDMTVTGGTIYAQGGSEGNNTIGIQVTGTATISGGSVWAGVKDGTGFDDAKEDLLSTDVAGTFGTDGFAGAKKSGVEGLTNNAAAYTRVKFAGLENGIYRVVSASVEADVSGDTHYNYGTQDVYVNPQGFAYFYLPNNATVSTDIPTTYSTTIKSIVVEDADGVRYQLHSAKAVTISSGTRAKENNYIELTGTWGEIFTEGEGENAKTYATGVDMALAKNYAEWGDKGDPNSATVSSNSSCIDTSVKLATLAFAVNHPDKLGLTKGFDWGHSHSADFAIGADIDMSAFLWAEPIGADKDHPFSGIIKGTNGPNWANATQKTVKGLRMGAVKGDAYGLFGYTDGANISYLTVSGAEITGKAYAKTLKSPEVQHGMTTSSGGRYKWSAAAMNWNSTVNYMGAIAGHTVNTIVSNCSANDMTMGAVNPLTGDACAGGLTGYSKGGSISSGTVGAANITADCQEINTSSAYAGGVVGYAEGVAITSVDVNSLTTTKVTVTAVPGIGTETTYAGGVAGKTVNCTVTNFPAGKLDMLTITAQTNNIDAKAYAGGVVGASEDSTFENVEFSTTNSANSVTAEKYKGRDDAESAGMHYAGGFAGTSTRDTVKDMRIIGGTDAAAVTMTANKGNHAGDDHGYTGGLAAKSDRSKFYRSFVRGVTVTPSANGSWVALINEAKNTQMYGCYAQDVKGGPQRAFKAIEGDESKYVGCYTTTAGFVMHSKVTSDTSTYYNCYDVKTAGDGVATAVASGDNRTHVTEKLLKGDAIAAMNNELMNQTPETAETQSGFGWAADFGTPIMYQADNDAVNGGFPVHGEMAHLMVTVSEGADYLAENGWINFVTPSADQLFGTDGSYWVAKGTNVTVALNAADGMTINSAAYTTDRWATTTNATVSSSTVRTNAVIVSDDTVLDFKIVPSTYYRYLVDLKDSGGKDIATNSSSGKSVTVSLGRSTVEKQSSNLKDFSAAESVTDTKVHAVILTGTDNAAINVATPTGWTQVANKGNFKQYYIENGASAADVQAFVRRASVVFTGGDKNVAVKSELNLLISEWNWNTSLESSFWNGHNYIVESGSCTWAQALNIVQNQRSLLGGMNGSLAIIDSAEENAHVAALNTALGWIAANDEAAEGVWVNAVPKGYLYVEPMATTMPVAYTNWNLDEPNNAGEGENFAAINFVASGHWNDYGQSVKLSVFFKEYGGVTTANAAGGSDAYAYTLTYTGGGSGGGSGGSGGGSGEEPTDPTDPTEPTPTDPDITGVADKLNTIDHMTYLLGYDTGDFGPGNNMTRAEAAMMFYRLLKDQNVSITKSFTDVPANIWYTKAVNTLASMGVIKGVGNDRFAPERSITRAEFVTIAMRFADQLTPGTKTFSDVPQSLGAYDYIMAATGYGWINGYSNGTFKPNGTITRAEVTTIVNHMLGRAADKSYVDKHLSELTTFPDVKPSYWAYYDILEATNAHDYTKAEGTESWTDK